MKDNKQLKSVVIFEGRNSEAEIVRHILANAGIDCFLEGYVKESVASQRILGKGFNQVKVMISEKDVEIAKPIVNEYFKSDNEE